MANPAEKMPQPRKSEGAMDEQRMDDLLNDLASDAEKESAATDGDYYEAISIEKSKTPVSEMDEPELLERFNAMMEKAHAKGGPLGERMVHSVLNSPEAKRLRELQELEVTSDMIVADAGDDSFEVKEELEVAGKDEATKARLKKAEGAKENRQKASALRGKLGDIKKKREADKADVSENLGMLQEIAREREMETPESMAAIRSEDLKTAEELAKLRKDMSFPPSMEEKGVAASEAAGKVMESAPKSMAQMKIEEAKFLSIPGFDLGGYEQAVYAVSNLEDEMAHAGFFKKLTLRGKLKAAKADLVRLETPITEEKVRANVARSRKDAGTPELSAEERARRDKVKRQSSRLGMGGGRKY